MRACERRWDEPLSAWLDGEAEADEADQVEAHLRECAACAQAVEAYRVLGDSLRRSAPEVLPPRVRQRALALRPAARWGGWRRAGAALSAAAVIGLLLGLPFAPGGLDQALAQDLTHHHYRAFSRAQPCDFESEDPEEVEAWLEQTLGYAVKLPEVEGAVLLGARRCKLGGVHTAAVLYRVGDEAVTVFLPGPDAEAERLAKQFAGEGARCADGLLGDTICVAGGQLAVSTLEPGALRAFVGGAGS